MNDLLRFLDNAEYMIIVHITDNIWTVTIPENKEFINRPQQIIEYNTNQILESGIPRYCITYYIIAHIILLAREIGYNPAFIIYYYNDKEISEDDVIPIYINQMNDDEINKLSMLIELIQITSKNNGIISNSVLNKAIKYGIDKDLLMLLHIVSQD